MKNGVPADAGTPFDFRSPEKLYFLVSPVAAPCILISTFSVNPL